MEKLFDFQKSFFKALFENDYKLLLEDIGEIENFEDRMQIYSNNIFSSLKRVLKNDFPYCRKILGEQKFNQASFEFVRYCPPTSGCLFDYGQKFPLFLHKLFPDFPYIQDFAQIEWTKKELYYKENSTPLEPRFLETIPSHDYPFLSFEFAKATVLFKSSYALQEMWQEIEKGKVSPKKPSSSYSYSLIIRPRTKVQHHWLSAEDFDFLKTLFDRKTLREAYDNATLINSNFNLSKALALTLHREYFTKATIDHEY